MAFVPIATRAQFDSAVLIGSTPESRYLDFKARYEWRLPSGTPKKERDGVAVELCRDLAQFANTDGGVLLIGVSETLGANGQKLAGEIKPIEEIDGFNEWMEQATRNYLTPSTFTREPVAIETANGHVLAVNVPPSLHLVALWHKELKAGIEYLYRTDHGKQWMNPDEVEKHLMNGSRAARLAVLEAIGRIKRARPNVQFHPQVELVPGMIRLVNGTSRRTPPQIAVPAVDLHPAVTACGDLSLSLTSGGIPNLAVEIPYELVRASWVTGDGRLGLCLDVRLCVHSDRITLNPLEQWLDVLRG